VTDYQTRPVRFLELWQESGWRIKVYGISHQRPAPRQDFVVAAKQVARERLPHAQEDGRHGVGYLGAHEGEGNCFAFFGWWAKRYELNHFLYRAPLDRPDALVPAPTGLVGCVWDLQLIAFERQAWLSALLAHPEPSLDGYLAMRLNADV
jgi:hypothetical protein